jgi:hypothetical protein
MKVVEFLYRFIGFLLQILEADAQGPSRIFWSVGGQEFPFYVGPDLLVEPDDVVQRIVPRQGILSEAEEELRALPLVGVPVGHLGRYLNPLDQLLGCNSFFSFVAEEQQDVGCSSNPIMVKKSCLKTISHFERSVVRGGDALERSRGACSLDDKNTSKKFCHSV